MLGSLEPQENFRFLILSKKELEKSYLHGIVKKIEDNDISPSLVLNLAQTPSKYIPVLNKTMAPKGSKPYPLEGQLKKG